MNTLSHQVKRDQFGVIGPTDAASLQKLRALYERYGIRARHRPQPNEYGEYTVSIPGADGETIQRLLENEGIVFTVCYQ